MQEFWARVRETLRPQINEKSFDTWIKPLTLAALHESAMTIEVPNNFFRDWIAEHYLNSIKIAVYSLTGKNYSIDLQVNRQQDPGGRGEDPDLPNVHRAELANSIFNPRYTFETFVAGAGNQFAHAACQAVADSPGHRYNPLFIYGGVGLGKTHLLNAIGHRIVNEGRISKLSNLCYLSAEEFTNELVNSIRYERMDQFRRKFRNINVLLIDDIQFISGKERTQIEFFHTFNSLYENKKQIVLTSDKFPREIPDFEERLKSRFEWGLIADIQPPDVETKVAILKKKAEIENIFIPNDVAFYLASNIDSNIRILEGCLIRLGAFASLTKRDITLDIAKEVLRNFIKDKARVVTIEQIQKVVASYFDLNPRDLRSKRRLKHLVVPRQIAMYITKQLTNLSLIEIGEKFGGKDHSTVIHSIKKVEDTTGKDPYMKNVVDDLLEKLRV
jgi:chromosomal replication initiator protein